MNPRSKITGGRVEPLFKALVLGKYSVQFYRCCDTGFIQTEEPYWLPEAYSAVIHPADVGHVSRNLSMVKVTSAMIERLFGSAGRFLDYGGGTGLFVRLMRDAGFEFLRADPFCKNTFSLLFDFDEAAAGAAARFDLLTAFEVFEHLAAPLDDIAKMFKLSDSILFSTELQPGNELRSAGDWWYFVPEAGQHIAFYNRQTLQFIADHFGASLHSRDNCLHFLTRDKTRQNPFHQEPVTGGAERSLFRRVVRKLTRPFLPVPSVSAAPNGRQSLIQADFEFVKSKLRNGVASE